MAEQQRGKLKIYMGYAAGVGKTFKMLEDAQELRAAGVDVVIGYFEPHGRQETIAKTEGLELIPRQEDRISRARSLRRWTRTRSWRGIPKSAWWTSSRTPMFRAPSALSAGRTWKCCWTAGIDVLTTMNIQHLESLNDQVWQISGIRVRETIPDWVVQQADEVVMVDLTPRALLHRLQRGVVYKRREGRKRSARISFANRPWSRCGSLRFGKPRMKSSTGSA